MYIYVYTYVHIYNNINISTHSDLILFFKLISINLSETIFIYDYINKYKERNIDINSYRKSIQYIRDNLSCSN